MQCPLVVPDLVRRVEDVRGNLLGSSSILRVFEKFVQKKFVLFFGTDALDQIMAYRDRSEHLSFQIQFSLEFRLISIADADSRLKTN